RAEKGDTEILPLVQELFNRYGAVGWQLDETYYGNLFKHTLDSMIKGAAGSDLIVQEALRRKIETLRDDLAGPSPSPLERILCERVALTWFDAHDTDRQYVDQARIPLKVAAYKEHRRD